MIQVPQLELEIPDLRDYMHFIINKTPAKHRDIFLETLIAKKWRWRGSNPRPTGWETRRKIEALARVRTQDLHPDLIVR